MTPNRVVYVSLLDEGTDVWRPVQAELIAPGLFRLIGQVPDGEVWQFQPGDIVRCERRKLSEPVEVLVAVRTPGSPQRGDGE